MKRFLSLCVLLCTLFCVAYAQEKFTGECGEKVRYTVDLKAKKLTLKGKGAMYAYAGKTPWSQYASDISTLEILGDVSGIRGRLFSSLTALETIVVGDSKLYFADGDCLFTSDSVLCMACPGNPVIPEWTERIGDQAFCMYTSLSDITIPSGVTSIGDGAFAGCTSLSSIYIPSTVKNVGKGAFAQCTSLTKATIAADIVGQEAFRGCTSLTEVTMLPSVRHIGIAAFLNCTSLTTLDIPSGIQSIEKLAFARCTALSSVNIPPSVQHIGPSAFYGCSALTTVTIASETIGRFAFHGCSSMSEVTMLPSVKHIDDGAFYECTSLASVEIPSSVVSIGRGAFAHCTALSKVSITSEPDMGVGAFEGCSALPVDNHVRYADKWAVDLDDTKQQSYTIRDGTVGISGGLFANCRLMTEVNIPSGVRVMGEKVFTGCTSLLSINMADTIPNMSDKALEGVDWSETNITRITESQLQAHGVRRGKTLWVLTHFPGGDKELARFLVKNISCPKLSAADTCEVVRVSFTVAPDGTFYDIKVDTTLNKALADELVRVVGIMPKWEPNEKVGKEPSIYFGFFDIVFPFNDESDVLAEMRDAYFPGGDEAYFKWLAKRIKYPRICTEQGVQGTVKVSFVVDTDGSLTDVRVLRSPDEELSKEALRLINMMPKWNPATVGNKTVRKPVQSRSELPITFRLSK